MRRPVRRRAPVPWQRWQYRQARPDGERWRPAAAALAAGGERPDQARRDVTERDDQEGQDEGASGQVVGGQDGLRGRFSGVRGRDLLTGRRAGQDRWRGASGGASASGGRR